MSVQVQIPSGDDRQSMVNYLVGRKYPRLWAARLARKRGGSADELDPERVAAAIKYRSDLYAMPSSELQSHYTAEVLAQAKAAEEARNWNQPYARTHYDFWTKTAYWKLDEAAALNLGRDPHHVTWEKLKSYAASSPFARRYERQRDLILRAKAMGQLFDPVIPGLFLAWAQRTEIELDARLVEAVEARGIQVADWKTHYDRMDEIAQNNKAVGEEALRRVAELEALLRDREALAAKGLSTRERNSLLKIVLGMAMACYKHDPRASRMKTAGLISDELEQVGLSVSDDTIRKYLSEAAEFAPPCEPD